ncbi:putative sporulation protein YtxC [Clostridium sp. UBA1056]|uniref:putative sporulation protein YtxC n=1 Tax=unclassified Clostridium TaxID=2614128 RepID=UPI003216F458
MLLLTIVNNSHKEYVLNQVKSMIDYLSKKKRSLNLRYDNDKLNQCIHIYLEQSDYTQCEVEKLFNYYMANILYGVITNEFLEKKVSKHLVETYNFLNYKDISIIKDTIFKVLKEEIPIDDTVIYFMNKKNNILNKIIACIEDGNEINIKGFIDFRVKELMIDIYIIVEKIVENYMIEKEYNEFISLLKYFIEVQESKVEKVDLYIGRRGDSYILKDEFGNDMMETLLNDLCENKNILEVSQDDLVISGLITMSPKTIVIHSASRCKNKELINTIEKVFEDRVYHCNGCNECLMFKEIIEIPIDNNIKV